MLGSVKPWVVVSKGDLLPFRILLPFSPLQHSLILFTNVLLIDRLFL